ncbi:hypothetical protein CCHL11_02766 [Colletotrichum chlorophyti]|uniref:Xylanolytic transcriptional activator regulatory domain-containing protein n=1 Tax=Colletotrichum chlorophyti TaxID=708187 RepID=A0A1Q8S300_9PEZI|nr:hypothetical protein CCHL11_02766 [Colletotrichum chlorophyti]
MDVDAGKEPSLSNPDSQQLLQERVERLERLVEGMKGVSIRGEPPRLFGSLLPTTSPASLLNDLGNDEATTGDPGMQVYEENVSYYLGPNYWLNLQDVVYEPRCLFRIDSDKTGKNPASPSSWPIGRTPTLADLSHLHLDPEKEDILTDLFFAHVEPYVRILHESHWRQQITDFRVGVHKIPVDVEAVIFATQAMTVSAMTDSLIQEKLRKPKADLLRHLQQALQLALERADILRSRKPLAFVALLYHIQAKFVTGDGEVAVLLLGMAGRLGTRIGLHRDPDHYGYPTWVANMRRRLWGHFELLDNPVYNLEGADSSLPFVSDVQPAQNANDNQWVPTRFAKPGSAPPDRDGITDMSFVLVRQQLFKTMHSVICKRNEFNSDVLSRIIDQSENYIKTKFIAHADGNSPRDTFLAIYFRATTKIMRLLIGNMAARSTGTQDPTSRARLYQECVEILEDMERGEAIAVQNHWGWLYRWPTMPCTVSNVLLGLAQQPNHPITDRAWRQVNIVFRRHNNEDISMRKFAAWRVIEALCDQAMLYHKQRSHDGAWYTRRLDQAVARTATKGKTPVSIENATVDDILGDVQMFGQDASQSGGATGDASYFSAQHALGPMVYPPWDHSTHSGRPGQDHQHQQPSEDSEDL